MVCLVVSIVAYGKLTSSKMQSAPASHGFSIFRWELQTVPLKWMHLLWEMYPGNRPSHSERYLIVKEYLQVGKKLTKESSRIETQLIAGGITEPANITEIVERGLSLLIFINNILFIILYLFRLR